MFFSMNSFAQQDSLKNKMVKGVSVSSFISRGSQSFSYSPGFALNYKKIEFELGPVFSSKLKTRMYPSSLWDDASGTVLSGLSFAMKYRTAKREDKLVFYTWLGFNYFRYMDDGQILFYPSTKSEHFSAETSAKEFLIGFGFKWFAFKGFYFNQDFGLGYVFHYANLQSDILYKNKSEDYYIHGTGILKVSIGYQFNK